MYMEVGSIPEVVSCCYLGIEFAKNGSWDSLASYPGLPRTRENKRGKVKRGEAWSILSRAQPQGRRQVDASNAIVQRS